VRTIDLYQALRHHYPPGHEFTSAAVVNDINFDGDVTSHLSHLRKVGALQTLSRKRPIVCTLPAKQLSPQEVAKRLRQENIAATTRYRKKRAKTRTLVNAGVTIGGVTYTHKEASDIYQQLKELFNGEDT